MGIYYVDYFQLCILLKRLVTVLSSPCIIFPESCSVVTTGSGEYGSILVPAPVTRKGIQKRLVISRAMAIPQE